MCQITFRSNIVSNFSFAFHCFVYKLIEISIYFTVLIHSIFSYYDFQIESLKLLEIHVKPVRRGDNNHSQDVASADDEEDVDDYDDEN